MLSNPPENIGYFATRPLLLRWLTGIVLGTALIAWLLGWIITLELGRNLGWNFPPFRWVSLIRSNISGTSIFVITSYAPLFSITGFCVIAGLRPALAPNLWVLVSLAMTSAAAASFAIGLSILLAGGPAPFLLAVLVSYLVLLPLLPMAAWVVNHRYNVQSWQ